MTCVPREPEPIKTWGTKDTPDAFVWHNQQHRVIKVCNRWRIHTLWWEPGKTVWREYVKLVTDTGILCVVFHDIENGGWYFARLYD